MEDRDFDDVGRRRRFSPFFFLVFFLLGEGGGSLLSREEDARDVEMFALAKTLLFTSSSMSSPSPSSHSKPSSDDSDELITHTTTHTLGVLFFAVYLSSFPLFKFRLLRVKS